MLVRWGLPVVLLDQRAHRDAAGSKSIVQQPDGPDAAGAGAGAGGSSAGGAPTCTGDRASYREPDLFSLPSAGEKGPRFPPFVNIFQSRTEQILDECIAAQPLISARWGHRVTGLAQDA